MKRKASPKFGKTKIPNLLRHTKTGVYYARVVHNGEQHWKSLGVTDLHAAEPLLAAFKAAVIQGRNAIGEPDSARTFGACAAIYAERVKFEVIKKGKKQGHPLSAGTIEFRLRPASTLERTWPSLSTTDIGRITVEDCQEWYGRFSTTEMASYTPTRAHSSVPGNSPTVTNACRGYLRRVFAIGIEKGYVVEDPSRGLIRKMPNPTDLDLPNSEQFKAIVAHVRSRPGPCPDDTADLIEGLAYCGVRLGEARALKWKNINFDKGVIEIRRDVDFDENLASSTGPKRGLKTPGARRDIPISDDMRGLLSRLPRSGPKVFRCKSALGSLASACEALGLAPLTHHSLRHYFATTCIQRGVDIPTLSYWLGHSDGGVLAMTTYLHYNPEHGARAMAKVAF